MTTVSKSLMGPLAISALLLVSAIGAGCSQDGAARTSGDQGARGDAGAANYVTDWPGTSRPFVDRAVIDPKQFGQITPSELGSRLEVDLKVPPNAAGGEFEGIYEPPGLHSFAAIYSNDVVIFIRTLRDPQDAADWIAHNRLYPDIAPHVTRWDLGGTEAYAIPELDVAPARSAETTVVDGLTWTRVKPGTGIRTGTAEVLWQRGRFVVEVMSRDQGIEALKGVARSVTFEPRGPSAP